MGWWLTIVGVQEGKGALSGPIHPSLRERERHTEKPGGRGKRCEGASHSEHTARSQKGVKAPTRVLFLSLGSASERRRAG